MELGGNARESAEIDVAAGIARARSGRSVGLGVVSDDVLSEERVIRVNFSMEVGCNARESAEIDVAAGIARARSGRSAAVGVGASLIVLAAATFELCCFARGRGEEPAFLARTGETLLCGFGFDLRVLLLFFRRGDFRWSFRVDFCTGDGDGEILDDALALCTKGVPKAATALGAEDRQPTNRAATHAVEI
jgi:hypothetical protein